MERVVTYEGKELARFDWVGSRDQDARSAALCVKKCFNAFPYPMPPQPRLLMIARILSAHVRQPLAAAMNGEKVDAFRLARDQKLEDDIVGALLEAKGLGYVDRLFRREQRRLREAAALKARDEEASKPVASEADLIAGESRRGSQ